MTELAWDRNFALEQAGDDEELLDELLGLLRSSAADDLQRVKQALAAGDDSALADAAHNTKGAAASLGVEMLRQVAADLERAGRDGDLETAARHLAQLEQLVGQLDSLR